MNSIDEKIKKIEEELARTQRNKATEHHIGKLIARIAQLKREKEKRASSKKKGTGYGVKKEGDAQVVFVGFPNAGKSSLLSTLTNAKSETANYAFTTLSVIPGMMYYRHAKIQLLDVPGLIEGASSGKGRGREILSVLRPADLLAIVIPTTHPEQRELIIKELERADIKVNKEPPKIFIRKTTKGGINVMAKRLTKITKQEIKGMLSAFNIYNADVTIIGDPSKEEFIEVLVPRTAYKKAIFIENKIDLEPPKFKDTVKVSCVTKEGIEQLKEKIFSELGLIRVYTKPKGQEVSKEPIILRKGQTVKEMCKKIYKGLEKEVKGAYVTGKSVKFKNQLVSLEHKLEDGDIVTLIKRR